MVPRFHPTFVGANVGQFCVLWDGHVKRFRHFTDIQTAWSWYINLSRFKDFFTGFILYWYACPPRIFATLPCQTNTTGTQHGENNKNVGLMSGHCLLGIKLHQKLTQHKKSAPDIRELKHRNISSRRRSIFLEQTWSRTAFLARIFYLSSVRIKTRDARRVKRREN